MLQWKLYPAQDFEHWRFAWDSLNQSCCGSALLESRFVSLLLHYFGNDKIRLAIGQRTKSIVAMALIEPGARGTWSTFQPSQAPLGLWLSMPDLEQDRAVQSLMRILPWPALLFGIVQQDPSFVPRLAQTSHLQTLDYIRTARIRTTGTFEDYWAARGKNLRHNLKRQRNRLEREGVNLRLDVACQPDVMAEAIADYGRVESAGWKNTSGTAISQHNVQGAFYLNLLKTYAKTGDTLVYRYFYNDRVVACDFCILGNGVINWLKTTYDESETTSSPAALLRQSSFEQVFADSRINMIEFYGPVMDWHTKWSDDIRAMYHVNVYRFAWLAKLHGRKHQIMTLNDLRAAKILSSETD